MENMLQNDMKEDDALAGVCWVCAKRSTFRYDRLYSNGVDVNWRERLVCAGCGLNNRLRLSAQLISQIAAKSSSIYLTEQVTPLAGYLARSFKKVTMSEFLGEAAVPGALNAVGIRHEDITSLSFGDGCFDHVLSFDVLEHVPDYRKALKEFYRVLKSGGGLMLSVPFSLLSERNIVRAQIAQDGTLEHLLPPEYHGDPVDPQGGILCYYHFGWQLVEELREIGFQEARVESYWSRAFGHIGDEQLIIVARR
ncbi:class I SAM-dependent methyltransferase [Dyella sp. KULCS107]|uniref:class I SAM-dependent methyltransferase n=1 Tax=Dyella sp. KULCS107 TaxID=3422216 RepID=UPI003D6FD923